MHQKRGIMNDMCRHNACVLRIITSLLLLIPFVDYPSSSAHPEVTQEKLNIIKKKCAESYPQELLIQFVENQGLQTGRGAFSASNLEFLVEPFAQVLRPDLQFIDLGSGDGRVVFLASLFGVTATGIEYDLALYALSVNAMKKLSNIIDAKKIHFIHGDFFKHNFSSYDVLYLFEGTDDKPGLKNKLSKEMKPGSILILNGSEEIAPDGLTIIYDSNIKNPGTDISIYKKIDPLE